MGISVIPNIIHFIYFFGPNSRPFSYLNYLAVKIAHAVQRPDVIYFYCNEEPVDNIHWENIKQYVTVVKIPQPVEYKGIELKYVQYQADIVRLQMLQKHGGIYMDTDTLLLKSLTPFLHNDCVMCYDTSKNVSINNALIMASPGSNFISTWLEAIPHNFKEDVWAYHAVVLPLKLYKDNQDDLTLLDHEAFAPFGFNDKYIFNNDVSNIDKLKNSYAVHLWDTIWNNELIQISDHYLDTKENLFAKLFKKYRDKKTMKIAIYTICKNEEQFVERWARSNKEADYRLVCDTGSTDKTVELLKNQQVNVHNIRVLPWRFDIARNTSLNLLPSDIDICIWQDLDEELLPGWRQELEQHWQHGTTIANHKYRYNDGPWQWHSKIHSRQHCWWTGAVHETLCWDIPEKAIWLKDFFLDEHQDVTKSRSSYLELLLKKIKEGDTNWRTYYFLSNDYESIQDYDNSIKYKILSYNQCLDSDIIKSYVSQNIARHYAKHENHKQAEHWFRISISHSEERESWFNYCQYHFNLKQWDLCYFAAKKCISINDRRDGFTYDPVAWSWLIFDYAALAAYYLGLKDQALEFGKQALELNPEDLRLQTNLKFYEQS